MADRNRFTIVCRDCGEVSRHDGQLVKPGAMVACRACGLLTDPAHFRVPSLSLAGPGFSASGTAHTPARPRGRLGR